MVRGGPVVGWKISGAAARCGGHGAGRVDGGPRGEGWGVQAPWGLMPFGLWISSSGAVIYGALVFWVGERKTRQY